MAGNPLGAAAPVLTPGATLRPFYRVPASTRTRRLQGVCLAGDLLLSVYSSRQAGEPLAVSIALQDTDSERISRITAAQARALAQAFEQAADAAESTTSASRGD
ncbi:hypothetical protein KGA65_00400 [Ideonella sp. B7]|uniref:hypothetical protein n=1 Tax=Ideonella benzenivorans TaxID=2831643 RepID=UPI001CEC10B7|nr:hypothetical protein [Ideonella benzenivorans]MCA6214992.1 hypothetical protein [Ideonella benzenivorans]